MVNATGVVIHTNLGRSCLSPEAFEAWRATALSMGFVEVAAGPLVRSSYRADQLAAGSGLLEGVSA